MAEPISINSDDGCRLLAEVRAGGGKFQPVIWKIFAKQLTNKTCGVQSCAMVLGAREIGANMPPLGLGDEVHIKWVCTKYNEQSLLEMSETKPVVTMEKINSEDGMTLQMVRDLLVAHRPGCVVEHFYASDVSEDDFRRRAIDALDRVNSGTGVVVNYHMGVLGQGVPYGHLSPLAAYHEESDRFLVLDTWRETDVCWAKTADLHKSMNTLDGTSGKTRGFCIVN